jgi:hypothetical protein
LSLVSECAVGPPRLPPKHGTMAAPRRCKTVNAGHHRKRSTSCKHKYSQQYSPYGGKAVCIYLITIRCRLPGLGFREFGHDGSLRYLACCLRRCRVLWGRGWTRTTCKRPARPHDFR